MRLSIAVYFLLITSQVFATSFIPISIKEQIRESDAIVYGQVVSKKVVTHPDIKIATEVILKVEKWIDLVPEDSLISVYYPGGTLDGKSVVIDGSPEFELNEKVVLFLGKDEQDKFWVRNLGLGKYTEKKLGTSSILVNQIFPNHPKIGQVPFSIFIEMAQRLKDKRFVERLKDKYENSILANKKVNSRKIASVKTTSKNSTEHWIKVAWLLIILSSLFLASFWLRRRLK